MLSHYKIRVFGKVQRVHFRVHAAEKARKLNLRGFVQNEHDGTVYIEVEGEKDSLDTFLDWCWEGSERANVDDVQFEEGELEGFLEFEIRR